MNTTNPTQTSSNSHWPKLSSFIHLTLLVLLSVFMVPQQGIAQQDIQLEFKKVPTPSQFKSAIESMDEGLSTKSLQTKPALIPTRWVNVKTNPSSISAARGGQVFFQGQLQYKTSNGAYSPLAGKTVYFIILSKVYGPATTNNNGFVTASMPVIPFKDPLIPPQGISVPFACVSKRNSTFEFSYGKSFFTLLR